MTGGRVFDRPFNSAEINADGSLERHRVDIDVRSDTSQLVVSGQGKFANSQWAGTLENFNLGDERIPEC